MDKPFWPLHNTVTISIPRKVTPPKDEVNFRVFREKVKTPSKLFMGNGHLPAFSGFVLQVKAAADRSFLPWTQTLHNSPCRQMRTKQLFLFTYKVTYSTEKNMTRRVVLQREENTEVLLSV